MLLLSLLPGDWNNFMEIETFLDDGANLEDHIAKILNGLVDA